MPGEREARRQAHHALLGHAGVDEALAVLGHQAFERVEAEIAGDEQGVRIAREHGLDGFDEIDPHRSSSLSV